MMLAPVKQAFHQEALFPMIRNVIFSVAWMCGVLAVVCLTAAEPVEISGRYPHLAMWNRQGECGVGAVVPWADRLWVITYGPHLPNGSDDKLYEIDDHLAQTIRPESVGGTPANRMIHRESNQLNIGPYFIDANGTVRVIPPSQLYGRLTATARHLTDPANKLYIYDMEGLLYEVDVHTLDVKLLFKRPTPGWHGKGCYSGQGRLVFANNGESPAFKEDRPGYFIDPTHTSPEDAGILAEWNGTEWNLIRRRQFTDITSPGGIHGPANAATPLWAIGWDSRSVLLQLCDNKTWQTFRLPVADYSYVAKHGWYTEWPRIREVTGGRFLMNMHGGWFDFPSTFASGKTGGIRPLGDYLKITGDFCEWNHRIVFGCDDGCQMASATAMTAQSNSNLWFTTWENLSKAGRPAGFGGPWVDDDVKADVPSEPFLLAGYEKRVLHLAHASTEAITFAMEIDKAGDGNWTPYQKITVEPHGYQFHIFPTDLKAEWVRLRADRDAAKVTAYFNFGPGGGATTDRKMFDSLADVGQSGPWTAAVMRSEGNDRVMLGVLVKTVDANGKVGLARTYQCDDRMQFTPTQPDSESARFLSEKVETVKHGISSDEASVVVTETKLETTAKDKQKEASVQRFRLPKSAGYDAAFVTGWPRDFREVVTERSLLNAAGSFFNVPNSDAGGLRRMKPICTHNKRITDFCSWRGLLVLAGCSAGAKPDGHYFSIGDDGLGLWFGDIDDLWKLGKPVGCGGPWHNTAVKADEPSDPYLMAGYDRKTLELSHDASVDVTFTVMVDVTASGDWLPYKKIRVSPGQTMPHAFPDGYSAHWVRLQADKPCKATATLIYE